MAPSLGCSVVYPVFTDGDALRRRQPKQQLWLASSTAPEPVYQHIHLSQALLSNLVQHSTQPDLHLGKWLLSLDPGQWAVVDMPGDCQYQSSGAIIWLGWEWLQQWLMLKHRLLHHCSSLWLCHHSPSERNCYITFTLTSLPDLLYSVESITPLKLTNHLCFLFSWQNKNVGLSFPFSTKDKPRTNH